MTLNLLKRAEKGSALSATEHDNNFTAIETEVNAKLDSSDASVTNAREWTAATATQAEAEAGTSTTRLAFTPLRVFQAIAAWWAASSAKTKLDGIASGATANATDAQLRDRATHTGTQAAGTIAGLSAVATTGAYADLTGKPTLGTAAAAATGDFATAAQGTKADSAMQASDVGTVATQVEVEAGMGTAVQRFSVLRLWQAIAAWWTSISTAAGRALVTAADAAAQRTAMEAARSGAVTGSGLTMATARLLGRSTAGTGAPEEITLGTNLSFTGTTLNAAGGVGSPGGSDTQVQFNDGGAFAGASGWTWNKTTNTMTLASGTQTTSNPGQVVTQTWNAGAVTFTGWRLNVTDTASAAASLLSDWQVGGTSQASISKTGGLTLGVAAPSSLAAVLRFRVPNATVGILMQQQSGSAYSFFDMLSSSGQSLFRLDEAGRLGLGRSTGIEAWVQTEAGNTLAQRNGTSAQESRIYGTFPDASNYRRLSKGMSTAGVAFLRPEGAGTGASGNVLHISGLPTSNPGPGILWNDAGTVKVGT